MVGDNENMVFREGAADLRDDGGSAEGAVKNAAAADSDSRSGAFARRPFSAGKARAGA